MKPIWTKMTIVSISIFIISLTQIAFSLFRIISRGELTDFGVYYNYSRNYLVGANPYNTSVVLNYPPSSLPFFIPFSHLPWTLAETIFTIISLTSLIICVCLLMRKFTKSSFLLISVLIFLLQSFPTKFTLGLGQINLIVLFFVILSFVKSLEGKNISSGIFWGLAMSLKLIPLPLGLYFLVKRRYSSLLVGLGIFMTGNLLILWRFPALLTYYLSVLPNLLLATDNSASIYDQSLTALLRRLGIDQGVFLIVLCLVLIIFNLGLKKFMKGKSTPLSDLTFFSLILILATIGNSFTWQHHLVFLFPGFIAEVIYLLKVLTKRNSLSKSVKPKDKSAKPSEKLKAFRFKLGFDLYAFNFKFVAVSNSNILSRGILLLISALLVGYHFPDPLQLPTNNPFLISHSLMGTLILIGLLLSQKIVRSIS